jgi:hypothetical protein
MPYKRVGKCVYKKSVMVQKAKKLAVLQMLKKQKSI